MTFEFKHKIYFEKQLKTKNDLYVYIKNSFQISRVELFWSLFNFRNKFIKQFAISKLHFSKLRQNKFFGEKNSFLLISDFRTIINLYKLKTPVLLKFNLIKCLVFILCFLFTKSASKSYEFFYKTFSNK